MTTILRILGGFSILGAMALTGCQTTTTATEPRQMSLANALERLPADCPYRADMPPSVLVGDFSKTPSAAPGSFDYSVLGSTYGNLYMMRCMCDPAYDMAKTVQSNAEGVRHGYAARDGYAVKDFKFFDNGNTKRVDDVYEKTDYSGARIRKGVSYFRGQCVQMIEASSLKKDVAVVDAFLATIRDPRLAQSAPTITTPSTSIESRLTNLKDLLDRRVITQQEYDERRRAIVGSL